MFVPAWYAELISAAHHIRFRVSEVMSTTTLPWGSFVTISSYLGFCWRWKIWYPNKIPQKIVISLQKRHTKLHLGKLKIFKISKMLLWYFGFCSQHGSWFRMKDECKFIISIQVFVFSNLPAACVQGCKSSATPVRQVYPVNGRFVICNWPSASNYVKRLDPDRGVVILCKYVQNNQAW